MAKAGVASHHITRESLPKGLSTPEEPPEGSSEEDARRPRHIAASTASPPADANALKEAISVRLASPRGFCAGVSRAIRIVEDALAAYGAPVYVRHEIVHNAHVVNRLRAMGAVFIDELADAPDDRPVILSAHGAPQSVYGEVGARALDMIDATCPLVFKVHNETRRHAQNGRHVVLIGHEGHPEVVGTIGQAPAGSVSLVEDEEQARRFRRPDGPLAYVTQTTLSVDDAGGVIDVLKERFPDIQGPAKSDICYATSNRQAAVKQTAPGCDVFLVVGDHTSSNSKRLVETALQAGAAEAELVDAPHAFDAARLDGARAIGVSAGASAPEELVEALLARIADRRTLAIETVNVVEEDVAFRQPVVGKPPANAAE